jgi:predicted N-formylglutamate amidohydrolase
MPTEGVDNISLLAADEPVPFEVLNPGSTKPLLLVCDHASSRFPASVDNLGVDLAVQRCHLGSDIGARALTVSLAERMGVTAVLQQYSRLVIDCNRQLLDPGAFLKFGDGVVIAGNRNLDDEQKRIRAEEIYWPYHRAIDAEIDRLSSDTVKPSMLAIHSFTPVLNGVFRPWQIGILWDKDPRIAEPIIRKLREQGLTVGDNEPYSGKALQDFTIDSHAEASELPHVGIEIRQDLIDKDEGVAAMADIFEPVIESIQAQLYATDIASRERTLNAR